MMLPWDVMLRAALRVGIAPESFWRLSLAEWRFLAGAGDGLTRAEFERLIQNHPDTEENKHGRI